MTGTLELEDLPKLDQMVENFYEISQDGPQKILRGLVYKISIKYRTESHCNPI